MRIARRLAPRLAPRLALAALVALAAAGCARATAGAAVEEGVAAVHGTTLAYEVRGRGPAVVLVHGGGFDWRLWDAQVAPLAARHRVIRYDVRGAGRSGRPGDAPFRHHEDLAALLAHLGVTRASIVGQSLGGRIALDLALAHPALVERIVAVGPGVSGWPWAASDFGPWLETFRQGLAARDTARAVEGWLASGYMAAAVASPSLRALVARHARENARAWFDGGTEPPLDPPALARLGELRAPLLVVVGERDEAVIRRIADTLAARVPGARRATVAGAGHAPNLERPEAFNRLLLDFMRP